MAKKQKQHLVPLIGCVYIAWAHESYLTRNHSGCLYRIHAYTTCMCRLYVLNRVLMFLYFMGVHHALCCVFLCVRLHVFESYAHESSYAYIHIHTCICTHIHTHMACACSWVYASACVVWVESYFHLLISSYTYVQNMISYMNIFTLNSWRIWKNNQWCGGTDHVYTDHTVGKQMLEPSARGNQESTYSRNH
jgi:hypothetical protein